MVIFLLTDKTYTLQIGFTHSTWTGFTFLFSYLLLEQFPILICQALSKFHNCGRL